MGKHPKVCIIILNWNGRELLNDCLSSLFRLTDYPNYKVIVVDNGSVDGSVEFVKKSFPKADVLALDKNYGFSRGNNLGMKYVDEKYDSKYVLLLNNDTEVIQKDWLTRIVDVAESDDRIGVVGCKLLFPDGRIQHAGVMLDSTLHRGLEQKDRNDLFSKVEEVEAITGAFFLIKKSLIKRIGLLDERFFFLCEDLDYCIRARRAGFKVIYAGNVRLIHKEGASRKKYIYKYIIYLKGGIVLYLRYRKIFNLKKCIKSLICFFR